MAKFFGNGGAFASNGDRDNIAAGLQTNGEVSYETGYGSYYGESLLTNPDARNVERKKFNQLLFEITEALGILQNQGLWSWLDYAQYSRGMQVLHNNDSWICINPNKGSEPAEGNDNWLRMVELFQQIGTSSTYRVTEGTNLTAPLKGSQVLVSGYWKTTQMPIQDGSRFNVAVNGQWVNLEKTGNRGGSKGHSFQSVFYFGFCNIYSVNYNRGDTISVNVNGNENLSDYYLTLTFLG